MVRGHALRVRKGRDQQGRYDGESLHGAPLSVVIDSPMGMISYSSPSLHTLHARYLPLVTAVVVHTPLLHHQPESA
jgi:hypothetical protein